MSSPHSAAWLASPLPTIAGIQARLERIFPEGAEGRGSLIGERAARTIFVFLYVQAVHGASPNRLRPNMVTVMTDQQAELQDVSERERWRQSTLQPGASKTIIAGRWYAENSREPIRDETIRPLLGLGAVVEDASLPTTSASPRYQLDGEFARLFDPALIEDALEAAITSWQQRHLGAAVRARIALARQQAMQQGGASVTLPTGEVRVLAAGPSTPLAKAVVEQFAPRFLKEPVVLSVTESRQRVAYADRQMLAIVKLAPDPHIMPDVVLADVNARDLRLRLVLLELVATGGPMTAARVDDLSAWLRDQGLAGSRVAFGTVFPDRGHPTFSRYARDLAWGSFAWLASEPEHLIVLLRSGHYTPQDGLEGLLVDL